MKNYLLLNLVLLTFYTTFDNHVTKAQAEEEKVSLEISGLNATISNSFFLAKFGKVFGYSLITNDGKELVRNASGFYCSINGVQGNFTATHLNVTTNTSQMVDIGYVSDWGELHYAVRAGDSGIYSYFIATGIGTVGEFRTLFRGDGDIFRNGYNAERSGAFPTLGDIRRGQKLQDETWRMADGKVYTKYNWATYVADDWLHGIYGSGHGIWLVSASHEYINGGPMKQELMVHVESGTADGVLLNMLSAAHFGTPSVKILSGKIYGPWLFYINNGSITDAESRAAKEKEEWPYKWLSNSHYQLSRASVTGTLKLSDGRPAASAMIILAKSGGDVYTQGDDYIFYAKADETGAFTINKVRSGTYTLYAYSTGGTLADITDQFQKDSIIVNGSSASLGTLTWNTTRYANNIWQIGIADRTTREYKFGNLERQHGLFDDVPANLVYTVNKSKAADDWYYAQTKAGTWTVEFSLNQTYTGNAHLTVAMAGETSQPKAEVIVNDKSVATLPSNANDQTIYRSGIYSGYYHLVKVNFSSTLLKSGTNTVSFHATSVSSGGGIMYDTIKLETE